MVKKTYVLVVLLILLAMPMVIAHDHDEENIPVMENATRLQSRALQIILIAGAVALIASFVALAIENHLNKYLRWSLFLIISCVVLVATIYSAVTTVYINHNSFTGGPVHWHADFEIYNCEESLDVLDPTGLSNRIGTPLFHEHNDFRIHVEGTPTTPQEISLKRFFQVIGGELTDTSFTLPTNNGLVRSKQTCNGKNATMQIFVYRVTNPEEKGNWIYTQTKAQSVDEYVYSPFSNVPPGDCIIVEVGPQKEKTDKLCESYRVAKERGELHGR